MFCGLSQAPHSLVTIVVVLCLVIFLFVYLVLHSAGDLMTLENSLFPPSTAQRHDLSFRLMSASLLGTHWYSLWMPHSPSGVPRASRFHSHPLL